MTATARSFLKDQDARQPAMELEVIGQTVKGRDSGSAAMAT